MSDILKDELIRLEAERQVNEEYRKKAETKFKELHPRQPGAPVRVNGRAHTLKYLWVKYDEGIPCIEENYARDPEWNSAKSEFEIWSPISIDPEKVTYLEPLKEDELERLQELNDLAEYEYQSVDSKSEAEELERERKDLSTRCGHIFKQYSPLFSNWETYTCEKCNYTLDSRYMEKS